MFASGMIVALLWVNLPNMISCQQVLISYLSRSICFSAQIFRREKEDTLDSSVSMIPSARTMRECSSLRRSLSNSRTEGPI